MFLPINKADLQEKGGLLSYCPMIFFNFIVIIFFVISNKMIFIGQ